MKDLTLEDFQKLKHWVHKNNKTGTCPHCGERCIIEPVNNSTITEIVNPKNPDL